MQDAKFDELLTLFGVLCAGTVRELGIALKRLPALIYPDAPRTREGGITLLTRIGLSWSPWRSRQCKACVGRRQALDGLAQVDKVAWLVF